LHGIPARGGRRNCRWWLRLGPTARQRGSRSPETRGPGATPDFAIDTYAAICNVHTYNVLRLERSYTPAQIETWWSRTLSQLLLA